MKNPWGVLSAIYGVLFLGMFSSVAGCYDVLSTSGRILWASFILLLAAMAAGMFKNYLDAASQSDQSSDQSK